VRTVNSFLIRQMKGAAAETGFPACSDLLWELLSTVPCFIQPFVDIFRIGSNRGPVIGQARASCFIFPAQECCGLLWNPTATRSMLPWK